MIYHSHVFLEKKNNNYTKSLISGALKPRVVDSGLQTTACATRSTLYNIILFYNDIIFRPTNADRQT